MSARPKSLVGFLFALSASCAHCVAALDWAVSDTNSPEVPNIVNVQLGWISLSDLAVPIYLVFDQQSRTANPFFGTGWSCSIFSSRCLMLDESILYFETPDGKTGSAAFDKEGRRFSGTAEWDIHMRGNDLILDSRTDESSITYRNGQIVAFQMGDGSVYTVQRENSRVSLQKGGISVLAVERRNACDVEVLAKDITSKIRIGRRPLLARMMGSEGGMVTEVVSAVEEIRSKGSSVVTVTYGENQKDLSDILIKCQDKDLKIEWSCHVSDNKLALEPAKPKAPLPDAIALFEPMAKASDSLEVIEFPGGKLAGRIRRIDCILGNERRNYYRASYDEKGLIVREKIGKWTRSRDAEGSLTLYDEDMNPRRIYRIIDDSICIEKVKNQKTKISKIK